LLLLAWFAVVLCFEVALEMAEYWVLAMGAAAFATYVKNRHLYLLLKRLDGEEKDNGSLARTRRILSYKKLKNVAAPYALCGLGIGALAWFILSLEYTGKDYVLSLFRGRLHADLALSIWWAQIATHYVCAFMACGFVGRALYMVYISDGKNGSKAETQLAGQELHDH